MESSVKPPVQAVIFTRVSKKNQEYTRQITDLKDYAQKMGWHILDIITEKITGVKSNDERDGVDKLLAISQSKLIRNANVPL